MKTVIKKIPCREIFFFGIFISLLLIISFIAKQFTPYIEEFLDIGFPGMIIYFIIAVLSVVLAPMNMLFLIPIATILWGPGITTILSIVGWLVGAQIAFEIARKGKHLLKKVISLEKLKKLENKMPQESLFISTIALRILIPVDILSYAIAFFTPIKRLPYFFSTLIGITPFAFLFAYIGAVSPRDKIILIFIGLIFLLISWKLVKKKK